MALFKTQPSETEAREKHVRSEKISAAARSTPAHVSGGGVSGRGYASLVICYDGFPDDWPIHALVKRDRRESVSGIDRQVHQRVQLAATAANNVSKVVDHGV